LLAKNSVIDVTDKSPLRCNRTGEKTVASNSGIPQVPTQQ